MAAKFCCILISHISFSKEIHESEGLIRAHTGEGEAIALRNSHHTERIMSCFYKL